MQQASEKKYRRSEQRQDILNYLSTTYEHPTAARIFIALKEKIPRLSLGNLYRNLGILVKQGQITKIREPGSDEDHFDGHVDEHFHFFCTACKNIFDIPADSYPDLKEAVNPGTAWQVDRVDVSMHGLCPVCSAPQRDADRAQ